MTVALKSLTNIVFFLIINQGGNMNSKIVCGIFFTSLIMMLFAQPEVYVERDDVPFVIGQWARYDQNTSIFQWESFDTTRLWWDLTSYPGGNTARVHLLAPNQGIPPAPDTFPNAKIVELDTMGSGDVVWSYLSDTTYFFYVQGIDMEQGGFRFIGNYLPDYNCYVYPIYDGASWLTAWTWTYEVAPGLPYSANETHHKRVVAMGKVKVPFSGDQFWPCLVIQDSMGYSDNFGSQDIRWIYEWVVPGRFGGGNGVAAAQSTNGANQNFVLVENFFKLTDLYVPGWDLRCPDFSNTTIWPDTTFAGPFIVSSIITDSTGIGADSLFYNIDGGQFIGVAHDSVLDSLYYYTIPQVVQTCTLGYFIWAEDSFSVANGVDIWNTDPICAPESTYYRFTVTTGIDESPEEYGVKGILDCYPNPFHTRLNISCSLPPGGINHDVAVFDPSGRLVKEFSIPVGNRSIDLSWDGTDFNEIALPNGVYFVELKTDKEKIVVPVVLIR